VLLLAAVLGGSACGDDTTVTTAGLDSESTTGTDTVPSTITITTLDTTTTEGSSTAVVDSTEGATSIGTDSTTTGDDTTTTGDDTTTGGPASPGQSVNQLVSAGERSSSPNYTLVYTFGQPSQLQSTHDSTNYRIQGGLIGANGSPP
jgi:hypothetical protein